MGRIKKYITAEEKRIANNKKHMEYYYRNQEKLKQKARENYAKKRIID
jgi:hypothetical protein